MSAAQTKVLPVGRETDLAPAKLDPQYPWSNQPRRFHAFAKPNGDARFGIAGQLVCLAEQRGHCVDRVKYLSRAEAEELRDELSAALRAFDLAKELARAVVSALPSAVACRAPYPFRDHRTVAELPADPDSDGEV